MDPLLLEILKENHDPRFKNELDTFLISVHDKKREWAAFCQLPSRSKLFNINLALAPFHDKYEVSYTDRVPAIESLCYESIQNMLLKITKFILDESTGYASEYKKFRFNDLQVTYTHMGGGILYMTISVSDESPKRKRTDFMTSLFDVSGFKV